MDNTSEILGSLLQVECNWTPRQLGLSKSWRDVNTRGDQFWASRPVGTNPVERMFGIEFLEYDETEEKKELLVTTQWRSYPGDQPTFDAHV